MVECNRCGDSVTHTFNTECYKCFGTMFYDCDLNLEAINHLADALEEGWITYYAESDDMMWGIELFESIDCIHILEEFDWMYGD